MQWHVRDNDSRVNSEPICTYTACAFVPGGFAQPGHMQVPAYACAMLYKGKPVMQASWNLDQRHVGALHLGQSQSKCHHLRALVQA